MQRNLTPTDFNVFKGFSQLSPLIQDALGGIALSINLAPGDILLDQGEEAQSFFLVQSGGVSLVRCLPSGKSVTIKIYGQGDIFGLLSVSGPYSSAVRVSAIHHSKVIAINGADARELMQYHPSLSLIVIDLLAAHIHHAHNRVEQMAIKKVDQRLAENLLYLAEKFAIKTGDELRIDVPLSQQDLAQFTGSTPETVNRTLKQWEDEGIIRCTWKHIDILKYDDLDSIAFNYPHN
ncbi:MAG: Crp/Fnr family transcriptional regulator [Chloroflexi bacterium]|nr:Crp/Fnr family transcriptional regulator [Chloroflexota bacterium]